MGSVELSSCYIGKRVQKAERIKNSKNETLWLTDVSTEVITERYRIIHLKLVSDRTEIKLKRHSLRHFPQFYAASFLPNWHFRFVSTFLGVQPPCWHNSVTRRQTTAVLREILASRRKTVLCHASKALDECECWASRSGRFTSGTHWMCNR